MEIFKKIRPYIQKNFMGLMVFGAILSLICLGIYISEENNREKVSYQTFNLMVTDGTVDQVILKDAPQLIFTALGNEYETPNPRNPEIKEYLLLQGIEVIEGGSVTALSLVQTLFSTVILAGIFYFVYRASKNREIQSEMTMETVEEGDEGVKAFSFGDVAGNAEAKESVADIVDFIQTPEKYGAYGARMPRGLIFYGPPGTGKTLLAKAIAGEAGVPFYAVSGSDFVQMYVGVGAGRIRELFKKARVHGKAVIFIDEIDALGKKRGASAGGGNDERDQTLNALLTEMSGFHSGEGIVVVAATNRLDTLDDALLRPGRFDRQIEVALPDLAAREEILSFHGKNKPMAEDVDMKVLAKQTTYFSGAMLENLLNESAIYAVRRGSKKIEAADIDRAYYTLLAGSEKKDRSGIREKDKRITAYHEAGHAVVTKLVLPENAVSKISIIPSTKGIGGFSVNISPDKMFYTRRELEGEIMIALGGRAAEELVFGEEEVTTGAGNDFEKASRITRDYIVKYGMGQGIALTGDQDHDKVREECLTLLNTLYQRTKALLETHQAVLEQVASSLLEKESLGEEELDNIMAAA